MAKFGRYPVNRLYTVMPPTLPAAAITQDHLAAGWPPVWWVGCHGGAGVTTLARLAGFGVDFGVPAWPDTQPSMPFISVVLVCRASAFGTRVATGVVEQWKGRRMPPMIRVLGIAAVAASPRRAPRIAAERLDLLAGWVPRVWRIGWVESLLAADDPRDVGMPPDVDALRHEVGEKVHIEVGSK